MRRPLDEVDVELDDMLGTGAGGSKHSQHVSHCLGGLRLNTVEQCSGAIGAELTANTERLGSGCDPALGEGRVACGVLQGRGVSCSRS